MVSRSYTPAQTPPARRRSRVPLLAPLATLLLLAVPAPAFAAEGGGSAIVEVAARLINFGILAGVLVYFLKTPIATYLASRSAQIRQDLVAAAALRASATQQLAEIERRMNALPAELDALTAQGAEDVKAERARIASASAAERDRLLEQTRREIDMRLRIAKRELVELAAELAVQVARRRIAQTITPDDHLRLVDRYASQLRSTP
jgi:F-type H+-transporting ATPase subunit b